MKRSLIAAIIGICISSAAWAQTKVEGVIELDRTVYDFGDVKVSDGPQKCSFTVRNISKKDVTIYTVVSSCGCTDVDWTRSTIAPGKSGVIKATYKNEDGPYAFDKSLTAYISDVKKPVVLKLRGIVHDVEKPLGELYPVRFGGFALKTADIKAGNMSQGEARSGEVMVANVSDKPVTVTFKDCTDGLTLKVVPATIPPHSTGKLEYSVQSSRSRWGKNYSFATPVVNGKVYKASGKPYPTEKGAGADAIVSEPVAGVGEGYAKLGIWTFTKENFSSLTKEQKKNAATPMMTSSTYTFNQVKAGTKIKAKFTCKNSGKSPLHIYKVDADTKKVSADGANGIKAIEGLAAGKSKDFELTLDTTGMPKGEVMVIVTLTTNSPLRPLIDLYITGYIK